MAKAPTFETGEFEMPTPARTFQTEQVDPNAGKFAATLGATAAGLMQKGMEIKEFEVQKQAKEDYTSSVAAPFRLFANEVDKGRDPNALLGEKSRTRLMTLLSNEIGTEDINDPRIAAAVESFNYLGQAAASRTMPLDMVRTLAQTKMKQFINANPGFDKQIRNAATQALGFDPTNADVSEAINILTADAKARAGGKDPVLEVRQAMRKKLNLPQSIYSDQDVDNIASKMGQIERRKTNYENEVVTGNIQYQSAVDNFNADVDSAVMGISKQILDAQAAGGGVTDPIQLESAFITSMTLAKQKLEATPMSAFANPSIKNEVLRRYDQTLKDIGGMIRSGNLQKIVQFNNTLYKDQTTAAAFATSDFGPMYALFGENTYNFIGTIYQAGGNQDLMKAMTRMNPKFAGQASMLNAVSSAYDKSRKGQELGEEDRTIFKGLAAAGLATPSTGAEKELAEAEKVVGEEESIDAYNQPKAVINTVNTPERVTRLNNNLNSLKANVALEIETSIPKEFRQYIKAEIVDQPDASRARGGNAPVQRGIKFTFDVPEDVKTAYAERRARLGRTGGPALGERLKEIESDLNEQGIFGNDIRKNLARLYKSGTLYGPVGALGDVKNGDQMLQSVIDELIVETPKAE